jgi:Mg-chelatase subunit ChlD
MDYTINYMLNYTNFGVGENTELSFGLEQPFLPLLIIPIVLLLYVYLRKGETGEKEKRRKMTRSRWFFLLLKFFIILFILIALASPYLMRLKEEQQLVSIEILADESRSMDIYLFPEKEKIGDDLFVKLLNQQPSFSISNSSDALARTKGETFSVNLRKFSVQGNKTEIGNALYQESIKENRDNIIILASDGMNNYGRNPVDVAKILKDTTNIFVLLPPQPPMEEIYIAEIGGERKIPVNTEYKTWIKVVKLGEKRAEYTLKLFVDGKLVRTNDMKQDEKIKTFEFLFSFSKSGVHIIEAKIFPPEERDTFHENNHLLKVVDVVDRPKVLVVSSTQNSPLVQILKANYRVHVSPILRENFKEYDLVILDNQPRDKLSAEVIDSLSDYLTKGNGLVVVGGENSFEQGDYANSNLERILPVISTEKPKEKRKPIAVLFLIDVSGSMGISTGVGYKSYLEETKAIVINLLRQLSPEDSVAVLVFNVPVWTLVDLTPIGDNRELIEENILKLKPASGGGTRFLPALSRAEEILKGYEYEPYVVFLSDGVPVGEEEESILARVKGMSSEGIKIYTVSVGDRAQAREGQSLMQSIARDGNGRYFWMEESQRLSAAFKEEEGEEKDYFSVSIYDKYHFITKDLTFETKIKSYNGVTPKSIAQILVSTLDKKPIVTVWRFGLGRVATITTDNGEQWSINLYKVEGGRLISRITNWAIGDLEKRKKLSINTQDVYLGDDTQILIKSKTKPRVYVEVVKTRTSQKKLKKEIELKQIDEELFSATLTPEKEGVYAIKARLSGDEKKEEDSDAIAVNPPQEYLKLGINHDELMKITQITNGSLYNFSARDELINEILKRAKSASLKKVRKKEDISFYFLIATLGLFFLDVVMRRIKEIMVLRKT